MPSDDGWDEASEEAPEYVKTSEESPSEDGVFFTRELCVGSDSSSISHNSINNSNSSSSCSSSNSTVEEIGISTARHHSQPSGDGA